MERLPKGPKWDRKDCKPVHPTKSPLFLFTRDPVDCLQSLLRNPLIKDHLHFTPTRIFTTAAKVMRVYSEWITGDAAWKFQVGVLQYAILLLLLSFRNRRKRSQRVLLLLVQFCRQIRRILQL